MKIKHRALALILSVMMVLTFMPAMAFAVNEEPAGGNTRSGSGSWNASPAAEEVSLNEEGEAQLAVNVDFVGYESVDDQPELRIWWYDGETAKIGEGESITVYDRGDYYCEITELDGDDVIKSQSIDFYVYPYEGYDDDDDEYDFGDLPGNLDNIPTIELDKQVNVSVNENEPVVTFKFEPDEDGYYIYESYGSEDPVGQVRTEEEIIDQSDDYDNGNFRIAFYAEAGETYYLQARGYNQGRAMSFQVKAGYRLAYAEDSYMDYIGTPVTLDLVCDFDASELTFNWYRYDTLIQANGGASITVNSAGRYYCIVSKGNKSNKVLFDVDMNSVTQNNLRFYYDSYDDTAYANTLWDDNDNNLTKGDVTVPPTVTFADGIARTVTYVSIFNPEMTSATIPASVTGIYPGLGMKSRTWDENDNISSYELIPGFVIYGKTGSAAQDYAARYGIAFRDLEAEAAAAAAQNDYLEWNGTLSGAVPAAKSVKAKAAKKKVTVSWKKADKKKLKKFDKVEIQVCPDTGFARANTIRKEVKKSKKSIKIKLQSKKTYFVRVRNVKGSGTAKLVSNWSSYKRVKIK